MISSMNRRAARDACRGICASWSRSRSSARSSRASPCPPQRPLPGALVTLTLSGLGGRADSIVAIAGTMAGEPLHFVASRAGHRALGAVPVDSVNTVEAAGRRDARVRPERHAARLRHAATAAAAEGAAAGGVAVRPPARQRDRGARGTRERARALAVGRRAHDAPPRWTTPFLRPRASDVTSGFGTGRTFNGEVTSRHLGVDFRGATGSPIRAANRGVVVLVDTFFLGGRVVYLDHGGGVTTGYLHLSKALVAVGDTVARGQRIGLVGATGRVTGPHLHWTARYGALTVNPLDLLKLDAASSR